MQRVNICKRIKRKVYHNKILLGTSEIIRIILNNAQMFI